MARHVRFVPIGLVVDRNTASAFGSRVAEAPILERMKNDPDLGSPGDHGLYADKGTDDSDAEMFVFMALRLGLPRERITEMRNYRAGLSKGQWSRPDAVVHSRTVREFYEIKPESAPSMTGGEDKFPNIERFMTRFNLPYVKGSSYLPGARTDEAPLLENNPVFQAELRALQGMLGLRNLKLFIHWETPVDGLIVYRAKVVAETEDPEPSNFPIEELAAAVVKIAIQAALGIQLGASASAALAALLARIREELDQLKRNLDVLRS